MSLTKYKQKRNFRKTVEPKAGRGTAQKGQLLFVVQKHAASRLHYDFRLELDGTLKSWAVPKGPSLNPQHKQLAVHVEDHPIAYGDFEGIIPKGEYGGGTVMVWDHGTWSPRGNAAHDYRAGKLKFTLHGDKLKGNWILIAMQGKAGADGRNWLLIKEKDKEARPDRDYNILEAKPDSVLTHRGMEEIAGNSDRIWSSHGASKNSKKAVLKPSPRKNVRNQQSGTRKSARQATPQFSPQALTGSHPAALPDQLLPQLATLVSSAPRGDEWLHEMKFDGYRLLAFLKNGKARLITRNGNDWTQKFPTVQQAVESLDLKDGILDGEVVLLRDDGIPDFQRLQNSLKTGGDRDFNYYAFDLPFCEGYDLRRTPLIERKKLLRQILMGDSSENSGMIRYSEHIEGQGTEFAHQSCLHEMEGIISKRIDSNYESGRSKSWVKIKCQKRQEFVIGGYTLPAGNRSGFGSLLLGYYEGRTLQYCGRVGTGFTAASLKDVLRQLKVQQSDVCPFSTQPPGIKDLASWVAPTLVAEVEFTEFTDDNILRHPSFKGLREDKSAASIMKEQPVSPKIAGKSVTSKQSRRSGRDSTSSKARDSKLELAGVTISNPDRMVFPVAEISKGDLAQFYDEIADWILPHIINRPLTLVRCPTGQQGQCFYQKHFNEDLPEGLSTVRIQEKTKTDNYILVQDATGLISLIQYGVMEIHPWGSRADKIEHPDRIVFDLDPGEETTWDQVIEGVKEVHSRLEDLGLASFLRTSGGKGLHVVVPLVRRSGWDEVKDFAHHLATAMTHDAPGIYVDEMSKVRRKGRIFVDYLRNGRGATAIASYSTRAREGAPIATPVHWKELTKKLRSNAYTVFNLRSRLNSLKSNPWEGFFEVQQSLTKKMQKQIKKQ